MTCAVPPALGPQDHGHIRTIASLGARVEHYDLSRGSLNPWGMFGPQGAWAAWRTAWPRTWSIPSPTSPIS